MESRLEFGWFVPTAGDTSAFGVPGASIPPSLEHFTAVARAAEDAGFEYALVPVQTRCYEAWVACSMISARTERLKMLVAARPGYIQPATMAKMVTTFDQLSGGRICVNLIAGPGGEEEAAEGLFYDHDDRYAVMDETVSIMKRLWTEVEPFDYDGRFFRLESGQIFPKPLQQPHPPFYLGGISPAAKDVCGKHADVFLAWLDTPERIAEEFAQAKAAARRHGREDALRLGVRAQVLVREREEDAWQAANDLIANAPQVLKDTIRNMWAQSQANSRMKELAELPDFRLGPHLWTGMTTIRPGAGVVIVGTPAQVAATLRQYVDLGAESFCLSSYPHHTEATRFGQLVMPLFSGVAAK
ncbi:MAG TPA: LLM class flavin-dependent oxidoreductase [Tepidiformaceae bacterium]|nr:LLM class flavin-dependent oxidoreductase [Tepidiformaceae bacterium]